MQTHLKKYINTIFSIIIFIAFLLLTVSSDLVHFPDSKTYLEASIIRTPAYPLFLAAVKLVTNEISFYIVLLCAQMLLGYLSAAYLANTIYTYLKSKRPVLYAGTLIILISPYFLPPYIGRNLLSEALAYPMLLIFISGCLHSNSWRSLFSGFALFVLLLTRTQFYILIPVTIIWHIFINNNFNQQNNRLVWSIKKISVPLLIAISAFCADKVYHKIFHNHFVTTPWSFVLLNGLPFYLSDATAKEEFSDPNHIGYFNYIYQMLHKKKLTASQQQGNSIFKQFEVYKKRKAAITNMVMDSYGTGYFYTQTSFNQKIANENINKELFLKLWRLHAKTWFAFYILNIIDGMGGWVLLPVWITIGIFYFWLQKKYSWSSNQMILLFLLFALGNAAIVALAEPLIHFRYAFYTWVLIGLAGWIFLQETSYIRSKKLN